MSRRYTPKYKGLAYHLDKGLDKHGGEILIGLLMMIVAVFGGLIWLLVLFFQKVHEYHLWKEFAVSSLIFTVTNVLIYSISLNTTIEVFIWGLLITLMFYCIYWGFQLGRRN